MKTLALILSLCAAMLPNITVAQPGTLDNSFDTDGKTTTNLGAGNNAANAMVIQPDGKIVVVGYMDNSVDDDFMLVRYNDDGSLDNTWSPTNIDLGARDNIGRAAALQSDGKIIAAGYVAINANNDFDFALVRCNTDGTLDAAFNGTGSVITNFGSYADAIEAVAIQADGKIVAAGYSNDGSNFNIAVARYNTDGSLDTSFDTDGKLTFNPSTGDAGIDAIAIQTDQKIVLGGYINNGNNDFAVARLNSDGSLDNSFSGDGIASIDFGGFGDRVFGIAIQQDGKIVAVGRGAFGGNNDFIMARYNTDGTPDNTFSTDGKHNFNFNPMADGGEAIALQPDGKILVAGFSSNGTDNDFAIARLNEDGSFDTAFSTDGKVTTDFTGSNTAFALAIQPDGKIVAAGEINLNSARDIAVARYLNDLGVGMLDFSRVVENAMIYPNPVDKEVMLEYALIHDEVLTIALHDMSGKLVKVMLNENRAQGKHREQMSFTDIAPGSYILTISNGSGSEKVMVTKQ